MEAGEQGQGTAWGTHVGDDEYNEAPSGGRTTTLTFVTRPNGKPALVFTYFIFSVNNGTTPPGGHIYGYPLQ